MADDRYIQLWRCPVHGLVEQPRGLGVPPPSCGVAAQKSYGSLQLDYCNRRVEGPIRVPSPEHFAEIVAAGDELNLALDCPSLSPGHAESIVESQRLWRSLTAPEDR